MLSETIDYESIYINIEGGNNFSKFRYDKSINVFYQFIYKENVWQEVTDESVLELLYYHVELNKSHQEKANENFLLIKSIEECNKLLSKKELIK